MKKHLGKFILLLTFFGQILFEKVDGSELGFTQIHPKSGTVIFVHGLMRSSSNMSTLAFSFKRDGWSVENWSYPSRQKNIEEHAEDLVKKMKLMSKQHPGKPISFVTHSMGGLVVRCALNHTECPTEAKMGRAALIAPPNKGSIFARKLYKYKLVRTVLGNKSGKQLMKTSHGGFDRLGKFPDHMPVLIIAGTAGLNPMIPGANDGKVGLNETCIETPHVHKKIFAGHSWICHTPGVIKEVKEFLSQSESRLP